jgi:undecaprenyl diphosphate synthase
VNSADIIKAANHVTEDRVAPPVHVAIIMDGNGRWAKSHKLAKAAGHKRGAGSIKTAINSAIKANVRYLTLYGFSSENWNRPSSEISDLMGLLRFYLKSEVPTLHKEGVCFCVIGDRKRLDKDIVKLIEEAEKKTVANTRLHLVIALSYGGRAEITEAARTLALQVQAGKLDPEDIDENLFEDNLYTREIPDPDLLIRTSGEQRISNFLLWQLAYAEFCFLDTLWPDFSEQDFDNAIEVFHKRERRFGTSRE